MTRWMPAPGPTVRSISFTERLLRSGPVRRGGVPAPERRAATLAWMAPRPLTIECEGEAWVLSNDRGELRVHRGGAGSRRLTLTRQQLTDWVHDTATPMSWFVSGALDASATLDQLLDYWVLVRSALDGTIAYAPTTAGDEHGRRTGARSSACR